MSSKINLDPYNQATDEENDWQTVPILRQHKNKKRKFSALSPEKDLPTQNRYSPLQVDKNVVTNPMEKTTKPPPILLYGIVNIAKLKEVIDECLDQSQYSFKIVTKNQLRVTADSTESYKKLLSLVREKKMIGHTFIQKNERPYRIVIKNLHHSTPTDAIIEAVESTGNKVYGEIINARYGPEKTPLSTWFVNLAPGPNIDAIKKLKYIYHTSVTIEDPKQKKTVPQCKRCQQYGHTKNYCMRPYRCVKCAES
ncbi:unnamed protein product [Plutella xylostella]|uniref:(diamondback moth) hypothetical protein n=1 Tax=Plutella xylostella TaxID=51655 RepID=A0A8S4G7P6_PLUXY|nr:unnamed protein product [Plutella xylostella]